MKSKAETAMHVSEFPPCECDHDFWNGINFHFPRCPKHKPVEEAREFFFHFQFMINNTHMHRIMLDEGYDQVYCAWHGMGCRRELTRKRR